MDTEIQPPNMRHPVAGDAFQIHDLIRNSPPLDLNSEYAYHLLCRDFASTCVVAERGMELAGFISGYVKPEQPDTLFIWQVVTARAFRKKGLALTMLHWLADKSGCRSFETTITPSNIASKKTFLRFAKDRELSVLQETFLEAYTTDKGLHEEEILFRFISQR